MGSSDYLTQGPYMPIPAERARLGLELDLVADYGASGSNQNTTGSIAANSRILTLDEPINFLNGQGISIIGAGGGPFQTDGVTPLTEPASLTVIPTGGTGSTQYKYWVCALDDNFGVTEAVSFSITDGVDTLSDTVYNALSCPALTGAAGYLWLGDAANPEVSQGPLGITPTPSFDDTGYINNIGTGGILYGIPPGYEQSSSGLYYLPITPPTVPVGDVLTTTILGGAGTNRLILADYATNAVTSGYVGHSDWAAFIEFVNNAIAQGRSGYIPGGTFVIDHPVYTDVTPGKMLTPLYLYGTGSSFETVIVAPSSTPGLQFYPVLGIPWQIDNPSTSSIYGLTLKGFFISLYSRNGAFTISDSGFDPSLLNAYFDADISILVSNVGPCLSLSLMFNSGIKVYAAIFPEQDDLSAIPVYIYALEYNEGITLTIYGLPITSNALYLDSETGGNTFIGCVIDGYISMADATVSDNTFINPYISTLIAAEVNAGSQNMFINPEIVSVDTPPDAASLTIIGGQYDNYGTGGSTGAVATDVKLTTTDPTDILTVPAFNKAYKVSLTFDVITAPTTVQAQVTWTDPHVGLRTYVWENASRPQVQTNTQNLRQGKRPWSVMQQAPILQIVGNHPELPLPILAEAGSIITVTISAGTANTVFATASIWPL